MYEKPKLKPSPLMSTNIHEFDVPKHNFEFEKNVLRKIQKWKDVREKFNQHRKTNISHGSILNYDKDNNQKLTEDYLLNDDPREFNENIANEDVRKKGISQEELTEDCETRIIQQNLIDNIGKNKSSSPSDLHVASSEPFMILHPSMFTQISANNSLHTSVTSNYKLWCDNKNGSCNDYNKNVLSDFEECYSNPFDDIEVKSINEQKELSYILNKSIRNHFLNIPSTPLKVGDELINGRKDVSLNMSGVELKRSNGNSTPSSPIRCNDNLEYSHILSNNEINRISYQCESISPDCDNPKACEEIDNKNFDMYNEGSNNSTDMDRKTYINSENNILSENSSMSNTTSILYEQENHLISLLMKDLKNTIEMIQSVLPNDSSPCHETTSVCTEVNDKDVNTNISLHYNDIVESAKEMGFPISRIYKAKEIFEEKDSLKIIEFLTDMHELEELGYSESKIEKALSISNYDKDKALLFLSSLQILHSIGFPETDSINALIKCDNDTEKAINVLISA